MSKLQSIFKGYADKLQVVVDTSKSRFAPTWFSRYFTMGVPKTTLSYTTIIGASRIEAAASIVDRDARTPLRSRAGLSKLSGEVPAIREMFKMSDSDYRDFMAMQALTTSDDVKKTQILDLIWNDTEKVGNAAMKRIDLMCLEAVSTGFITIDINTNPDGPTLTDTIDLLMDPDHLVNVVAIWSDAANAKPITDILTVIKLAEDAGKSFGKILMTRSRFFLMTATIEARNMVSGFLRISTKDQINPTLSQVNDYLTANQLPVIEIVNEVIGIEKDGKIAPKRPWKEENVSFVPSGQLGIIHNAIAVEQLRPVTGVSYASFNNALISKWSENEPFGEYTKVEFNAFPGVEAIDGMYILRTTTV